VTSGSSTYWQLSTSTCDLTGLGSALQGIQFVLVLVVFLISLALAVKWYD